MCQMSKICINVLNRALFVPWWNEVWISCCPTSCFHAFPILNARLSSELLSVLCLGGWKQNRFIETDLVPSFLRFTRQFLSPQILLCRFFRLTKVQAWLISLCDRCVGDSSAIIIETQPPLSRIAASLSFMNVHGGEKQIIIVSMDLSVLFLWICSCIVLWICMCIVLWICLYIPPPPLPF